ncbi:hypothetical protein AVEN_44873-1 [Araneus ventricosus]|uniref:Uncharacterized protein n=1 Tax=Araneus ventricosus TaxID=182803 RepID=A0A4Y2NYD3_ARAVE|nr:hypothetical protein AVEN_44873-1 [Araneus ventricosus]
MSEFRCNEFSSLWIEKRNTPPFEELFFVFCCQLICHKTLGNNRSESAHRAATVWIRMLAFSSIKFLIKVTIVWCPKRQRFHGSCPMNILATLLKKCRLIVPRMAKCSISILTASLILELFGRMRNEFDSPNMGGHLPHHHTPCDNLLLRHSETGCGWQG